MFMLYTRVQVLDATTPDGDPIRLSTTNVECVRYSVKDDVSAITMRNGRVYDVQGNVLEALDAESERARLEGMLPVVTEGGQ